MDRTLMKDRRHDLGLTMKRAGEMAGISESHWSKIEAGHKAPSVEVAGRIARMLGEPATDLFHEFAVLKERGGDDEPAA